MLLDAADRVVERSVTTAVPSGLRVVWGKPGSPGTEDVRHDPYWFEKWCSATHAVS